MRHKTAYSHFLLLVLVGLLCPVTAVAQSRIALVIGNDHYQHVTQLKNAASDAQAVGVVLRRLGFEVLAHTNLDRRGMNQAIGELANRIARGGVGVLFFAGHGVQMGGENFLLPIDIRAARADDLVDEAVALGRVMERLALVQAKFTLLILDACRDNPFPKAAGRAIGGTRGLTIPAAPDGLMVIYSAGINEQALDRLSPTDNDPNSLFTREFLRYLQQPGIRVDDMLKKVRHSVRTRAAAVGHSQNPAIYDQSSGDFYFLLDDTAARPATDPTAVELAFWDSVKNSTNRTDFEEYLKQYPQGYFVGLAKNRLQSLGASFERVSAQASNPRLGTWKLNLAKSKFDPGPAPQSNTMKIEAAGEGEKVTTEGVNAAGAPTKTEYTAQYDGKDYPLAGSQNANMVSLKRIDARTLERTDKKGDKVVLTSTRVVSEDGKTMTVTTKGTNAQGQAMNNVTVWEKQ